MTTKIKICGLVRKDDAEILNKYQIDFAGFVLFFPKSKRCIELEHAKEIMSHLNSSIKKVAVTVSPTLEQVSQIQAAGFDMLQVHGKLKSEVLSAGKLPILRAINISDGRELESLEQSNHIAGYVCDSKIPGSGKAFDWNLMKQAIETLFYKDGKRNQKLFVLAGGLYPETVEQAIKVLHPDIVDVSSGVELSEMDENEKSRGKDIEKVRLFYERVNNR